MTSEQTTLTDEALMEMMRQRGLTLPAESASSTEQSPATSLQSRLRSFSEATKAAISAASSPTGIPQGAKTELLDIACDHLLKLERYVLFIYSKTEC